MGFNLTQYLNKNNKYADYLAENIEHTMQYSEYLAKTLDKSIERICVLEAKIKILEERIENE